MVRLTKPASRYRPVYFSLSCCPSPTTTMHRTLTEATGPDHFSLLDNAHGRHGSWNECLGSFALRLVALRYGLLAVGMHALWRDGEIPTSLPKGVVLSSHGVRWGCLGLSGAVMVGVHCPGGQWPVASEAGKRPAD